MFYLLSFCLKDGKQYKLVYAPSFEEAKRKLETHYFFRDEQELNIENETITE